MKDVRKILKSVEKSMNIIFVLTLFITFCSCSSNSSKKEVLEENGKITIRPKNSIFSGHELVIIPDDPTFSPSDQQISDCLNFLENEYPGLIITSEKFESIEYVSSGQNFESVNCNLCDQEMQIEFWQEQMSNSYENSSFEDLSFTTECCNERVSLNDLKYNDGSGFSSYEITINNAEPNDTKETTTKNEVSEILGTETKVFWRHI